MRTLRLMEDLLAIEAETGRPKLRLLKATFVLFNLLRLRILTRAQPQNHARHLSIFILDEHHFRLGLFSEELSL